MNDRKMNQQDRVNQSNVKQGCAPAPAAMRRKLRELGLTAVSSCAERRAVVYNAGDRAATAVARCLAGEGGALLPVDVGIPYHAHPKVRMARRAYEATWGLIGSIVEPADAAKMLAWADGLVVVTDVWSGRPSAPIAEFLDAHRSSAMPIEFVVLADESEVARGFLARIAEHLNPGTPVHVSYVSAAEGSADVDELPLSDASICGTGALAA